VDGQPVAEGVVRVECSGGNVVDLRGLEGKAFAAQFERATAAADELKAEALAQLATEVAASMKSAAKSAARPSRR